MKMKSSILVTAGLLVAQAGTAAAQEVPDTTRAVPLEGVTVSVLRSPILVTNAPFAVDANTQEEIQRGRPGLGLDEALGGIPGVQVDDRYNYAVGDRISIRGFGARTPFGVRGVSVTVDGIPATLPDGTTNLNHVDLGFLRRAEVIRGPASALYGNAAGGVIQFETELPPLAPVSQAFGFVAGEDGLLRLTSTTGGRSEDSYYLVNVSQLTYDGYRPFQDAKNLQLNGSIGTTAFGGNLRVNASFVEYDANNPGSLNAAQLEADRFQAAPPNLTHNTGEDGKQAQAGLSWRGALGPGQLELAGYGLTREIVNPIPFNTIIIDRNAGGLNLLYRSTGDPAETGFGWGIGAEGDVQYDDRTVFPHNASGARLENPTQSQDEEVLGGAVFAQVTAVPTPRLTALAGVRYDVTRFKATDRLITDTNPDDSGERTMNAVSPSIGLSYELFDNTAVYGNVGTSFETPTATELANQEDGSGGFNANLEPQKTLSYEVGLKGLVGALAGYQLAVYRAEIDDALIPFTAGERTFYRNAGSAIHQGVELGLTVVPVEPVSINVAYTYVDATFDDYVVDEESFKGRQIPGVSPHRVDASLTLQAPFGFFLTADARYMDKMQVNDANTAEAPAYTLVDLRAGFDEVSFGGFSIEPFVGVTNVFDEEYITSPSVNHAAGRYFEPGPGRAAYVGGQIRFSVR